MRYFLLQIVLFSLGLITLVGLIYYSSGESPIRVVNEATINLMRNTK